MILSMLGFHLDGDGGCLFWLGLGLGWVFSLANLNALKLFAKI